MSAREERLVTPETIAAVDQWLDDVDVFAKAYWQYVDGNLVTVGLRIGEGWDKVVAFFGDTVVRHENGRHTVLSARDAAEVARMRAERHSTNEALDYAVRENAVLRARVAELEAATICSSVARLHGSKCVLPVRHRGDHQNETKRHYWSDDYAVPQPRQAEDPHDSELHHTYALDLPVIPHQRDEEAL